MDVLFAAHFYAPLLVHYFDSYVPIGGIQVLCILLLSHSSWNVSVHAIKSALFASAMLVNAFICVLRPRTFAERSVMVPPASCILMLLDIRRSLVQGTLSSSVVV